MTFNLLIKLHYCITILCSFSGLTNIYEDEESECGKWLNILFGLSLLEPHDEQEESFVNALRTNICFDANKFQIEF